MTIRERLIKFFRPRLWASMQERARQEREHQETLALHEATAAEARRRRLQEPRLDAHGLWLHPPRNRISTALPPQPPPMVERRRQEYYYPGSSTGGVGPFSAIAFAPSETHDDTPAFSGGGGESGGGGASGSWDSGGSSDSSSSSSSSSSSDSGSSDSGSSSGGGDP